MKPKNKKNKLPPSSWVLYVKLYCHQKGSLKSKYNSNLVEATKSWLSLSESEKQQFKAKLKEYEQKYRIQHCEQLKNAKLFMKKKDVERTKGIKSTKENLEPGSHVKDFNSESVPVETAPHIDTQIETASEQIAFEESNPHAATPNFFEEHSEDILEAATQNNDEALQPVLIEPLAPTIKSGHELFFMLNSTNEDNNAWASLPQIEKNRYSRAVSIMKKDYITKYKEYLESLSPKELFDYYNKTIF